ncbi:MAG TPA: hypothetical protein VNA13_03535 [Xanthomonadales bacterium]|nr:hypothetical protein [Xanthomonadales bacterium]
MERRHLLIIGGVLAFLILLFIILVAVQSRSTTPVDESTTEQGVQSNPGPPDQTTGQDLPTQPTPDLQTPEKAATGFYNWYVSTSSPLTSGAYKNRRDITAEYKETMGGYVIKGLKPDRDPVFNCGDPNLPKSVKAQPAEIDTGRNLALVTLQESSTQQNMFLIKLEKTQDNWQVRDVWCAPDASQ